MSLIRICDSDSDSILTILTGYVWLAYMRTDTYETWPDVSCCQTYILTKQF